jgi:hypothetical protein
VQLEVSGGLKLLIRAEFTGEFAFAQTSPLAGLQKQRADAGF